ncbi:MAG: nuclear transport factor 2 family protein, partial [Saprospiraceae bacterium]|nr:nuclear transport factor 2 family protein [Saprospiraceae bacterium]
MPNKILVLLVGLLAAQCSPRLPAAADNERAERIIRHNIAEFSRQLIAGNYEAVTQAYAPDAKIFPPGLDILRRHEAIRNYWTPPPGRDSRTVHHRVSPEEIQVSGNLAYDWGYYEGRTR